MICSRRMDTLNTHIDAKSTSMGTSETRNENAAAGAGSGAGSGSAEEDDFKLNIPYFDETAPLQHPTSNDYNLLNRNRNSETSPDIDDLNSTNWDNDDTFGDDNVSHVGSSTSAQSSSASPNLYPPPPGPPLFYGDPNDIDIKYPPSELLLQLPSRYTTLNFELQQQQQRRHLQPLPPPFFQHMHPALQQQRHQLLPPHHNPQHPQQHPHPHLHHHHHHPQHHPQYGGICDDANGDGGNGSGAGPPYQQQPHPTFHQHPNMWYPNAPYGSSRYNYDSNRYPYHYNAGYGQDPVMDMLQLSNSGREARNRAEKNRRDKLNGSIQELSTMVPHVAESPRRVDKTAVLRFAAHGLRLKYVFGESQERTQVTDSLMKLLDSFFITLTCHGQIVLISSSIEQHLGHCQADLYGQNILHITHPEDQSMLKHQLIPNDLENLFDMQPEDEASGEARPRTQAEEELIDKKLREDKRSFTVRLARAGPRSEPTTYEVVRIDGCFRRSDSAPRGVKSTSIPPSLQLIRRGRGRDDSIPLRAISGNDIVLIGIARIIRPPKIINRIIETNNLEYKTRHLIDGRIIDCDQRIGIVAGYMTDEVRNLSPFTFMHQDDARWVIVALRQMYDCNSSYGESTYRLLSRNGSFIYLQSRGYLEIDKNTNKVHSFVCINTLLEEEEGKRRVEEMKRKFSIIINAKIPATSIDAPASENPQQIEKAVLRLIQNLQKSSDDEENYDDDNENENGNEIGNDSYEINEKFRKNDSHCLRASTVHRITAGHSRSTKTPPLALVPPETASVKSSISKSVSVVNVTAARHLRTSQLLVKSPLSTTTEDDDDGDGDDDDADADDDDIIGGHTCTCSRGSSTSNIEIHCECYRRFDTHQTVGLAGRKRTKFSDSAASNDADDDDDDDIPQKRSLIETDFQRILSTDPTDQIDQSVESEIRDIMEIHVKNRLDPCTNSDVNTMEEMRDEDENSPLSSSMEEEHHKQS